MTRTRLLIHLIIVITCCIWLGRCYDPADPEIVKATQPKGHFEAFYPRGEELGSARAAHSHGSFYKHRNPALVDAKNAAAYGFRFDGKRRFNYD